MLVEHSGKIEVQLSNGHCFSLYTLNADVVVHSSMKNSLEHIMSQVTSIMSTATFATLSDGYRIPLITCGSYDCTDPESKGKSLGILYINGMLGCQVYNLVVTKSKKEVHLTVYDRLYANPSHDSIHILQTYMQDMDLANVLMDQVPRYCKIVVQFRAPLSEQ